MGRDADSDRGISLGFLDEHLTLQEIGGLMLAALGILLVQVRRSMLDYIFNHSMQK